MRAENTDGYIDYSQPELVQVLKELLSVETNLNALALHAALHHGTVASVAAGASSPAQIRDTIDAYNTSISNEQIEAAKNITKQATYKEHRE